MADQAVVKKATKKAAPKKAPAAKKAPAPKAAAPKKEPAPKKANGKMAAATPAVDAGLRATMIAEAAYYRAEQRGFNPGNDVEDWLSAERDIDARLGRS